MKKEEKVVARREVVGAQALGAAGKEGAGPSCETNAPGGARAVSGIGNWGRETVPLWGGGFEGAFSGSWAGNSAPSQPG